MDSNTSSEANIKYEGDKNQQKITSDTDFYMNLLANPNKIKPEGQVELGPICEDSTSKISDSNDNDNSDSDSDSTSSRSSSAKKSSRSAKSNRTEKTPKISLPQKMDYPHYDKNITDNTNNTNNTNNTHTNKIKPVSPIPLTDNEIKLKKIDMLRKLSELKSKGYELSKEYNFNSSLTEMEYEYDLLRSYVDKRNGVKMYKSILTNGAAFIEFFNEKYDPFEFELQGWSEHMSIEIDSYEEVIEELYEKYKGSARGVSPEVKLMFFIFASGAAFHYSKSTLGKAVGLGKPGFVANIMKPKNNQRFVSQQELNLQNLRNRNQQMAQPQTMQQTQPVRMPAGVTQAPQVPQNMFNQSQQLPKQQVKIPSNVNNILQKLKAQKEQNNRVVSETTINSSEMNTSERKKRGRKPKSVIHIET